MDCSEGLHPFMQRYVAHPKLIWVFRETEQHIMLSDGRTISGKEE